MDADYVQREDDLQNFTLDPSDPLNLLLQSTDTDDSSASADSPDWSQYSSLWPSQADTQNAMPPSMDDMNSKFPDFGMDFDFSSLPDLDLTNGAMAMSMSMSVDPSALHFDNKAISQPEFGVPVTPQQQHQQPPQNMFAGGFPFTFSPTLSTTSVSSNSTADKSPIPSEPPIQVPAPAPNPGSDPNFDFTAALHAALNINPKLPIPRLMPSAAVAMQNQQPALSSASSTSSSPSPGPSTPPDSTGHFNAANANGGAIAMPSAPAPRPKTSHTTIERRYRTNLNARIQGLRQAVPALRVLDPNTANADDVVDERGYIDGVKVARKGSKANVLGKAVEYIRVLKRRESRLIREQFGLRTLISGLPGGANLLGKWESEWVAKFGGPERDELTYADAEELSDDEDGDGDGEGDGEDAADAPRKRVRLAPVKKERATPPVTSQQQQQRRIAPSAPVVPAEGLGTVPEKRKRGRPRKIQPGAPPAQTMGAAAAPGAAPVMLADPAMVQQLQMQQQAQQGQPQQYLLAVFALFSFFNSPLTSYTASSAHQQHHAHTGSVLSHSSPAQAHANATAEKLAPAGMTWATAVQTVHLLASLLVIVSVVFPLLPRRVRASRLARLIPFSGALRGLSTSSAPAPAVATPATSYESVSSRDELPTPPESPVVSGSESETEVEAESEAEGEAEAKPKDPITQALMRRGQADEKAALLDALNLAPGVFGAVRSALRAEDTARKGNATAPVNRAWARLGEVILLEGATMTAAATRMRVYSRLSASSAGGASAAPSETATAALLARTLPMPFARSRAERLWDAARTSARKGVVRACERLVLDTLLAEEAGAMLDALCARDGDKSKSANTMTTPLDLLAIELVYERVRAHAAELFVERVMPESSADTAAGTDGSDEKEQSEDDKRREKEARDERWRVTVAAARSLGGAPRALADAFERAWTLGTLELAELVALGRPAPAAPSSSACSASAAPQAARNSGSKEDARVLLAAVVLHRKVFPRAAAAAGTIAPSIVVEHACVDADEEGVLSPPPTPPRSSGFAAAGADVGANATREQERAEKERERDVVRLRRVLGSGVFDYREDAPLLEDARDCVVDRLVDGERRVRGRS
ncbi:hypothetical protein CONPUDRAFT_168096 [Coniophora puteana RWD-64-598 SS2]|uniref:BHLH domain-containing protein n=1 Tax=Coniophora puteana (strain RWD-64-598) TaxID=741705 RepID=A0A5M3MEP6_CONPW|nr:uncharacterized protein CONPUDRAFT_168096 [Coniophora puteana RWD-64-598 SS2]EIW77075.1 hypothetical protein CONPUDRAFT_168096 [Coniophora puteana RWD-64-598 SS2]